MQSTKAEELIKLSQVSLVLYLSAQTFTAVSYNNKCKEEVKVI